jgi:hypothetical protein
VITAAASGAAGDRDFTCSLAALLQPVRRPPEHHCRLRHRCTTCVNSRTILSRGVNGSESHSLKRGARVESPRAFAGDSESTPTVCPSTIRYSKTVEIVARGDGIKVTIEALNRHHRPDRPTDYKGSKMPEQYRHGRLSERASDFTPSRVTVAGPPHG